MCACQNQNNQNGTMAIVLPDTTINCNTPLSFLKYLVNLIDLNINNSNMSNEDKFQLQIYKGQVQSGINIGNYCYINYAVLETNIINVVSKYS